MGTLVHHEIWVLELSPVWSAGESRWSSAVAGVGADKAFLVAGIFMNWLSTINVCVAAAAAALVDGSRHTTVLTLVLEALVLVSVILFLIVGVGVIVLAGPSLLWSLVIFLWRALNEFLRWSLDVRHATTSSLAKGLLPGWVVRADVAKRHAIRHTTVGVLIKSAVVVAIITATIAATVWLVGASMVASILILRLVILAKAWTSWWWTLEVGEATTISLRIGRNRSLLLKPWLLHDWSKVDRTSLVAIAHVATGSARAWSSWTLAEASILGSTRAWSDCTLTKARILA